MRVLRITSDTQIATSKVEILGVQLSPDGTNEETLVLYNEATSSKTAASQVLSARTAGTASKEVIFTNPMVLEAGCYADIGGTGAVAFIYLK